MTNNNKKTALLQIEELPKDIAINDTLSVAKYFGYTDRETSFISHYFLHNHRIYQISTRTLFKKATDGEQDTLADFYCYDQVMHGISVNNESKGEINKDLLLEIVAAAHGKKLN